MIRGLARGMATHSQRLEKWLGRDETERLSAQFKDFYWPVAVHGVPGRVYVMPGGDFAGPVEAGQEMSALDRADAVLARHRREVTRYRLARMHPRQRGAFADLNALLQAQRGGNAQTISFTKTTTTGVGAPNFQDSWYSGALPAAGAAGAVAPGGTVPTNATTGAMAFANPVTANTAHLAAVSVSTQFAVLTAPANVILYDRLFSVAKTPSSTATQAVTGVPTRYTSQTSTDQDYIGGNFVYPVATSTLGSTAHNWTVCKYTNQAGTTGQSMPSSTGVSALPANNLDFSTQMQWFMPLASGDVGVKALTQMQCSASVSGPVDFVVGHVIAALPVGMVNLLCLVDGINTAFNLVTVYDNACLSLLCAAGSTTAGSVTVVSE